MHEEYCTLDPVTRKVTVAEAQRIAGVESDENARGLKFKFPKIVDGTDLTRMQLRINFMNSRQEKGRYIITDVRPLETDGDFITFSWTFSRLVTRCRGLTKFVVCAVKTDSDGTITTEWNTALAQLRVFEGLEVDEPTVTPEEKDVIAQLISICEEAKEEAQKALGIIPVGGKKGQVLTKLSDTDKDYSWENPTGGGGTGERGATFTPAVSPEGIISWTNDKNLPNPASVDIKGPQGARGVPGADGMTPNLQIGTVTTLPPGSEATASITGTSENPLLNLGLPQGEVSSDGGAGKWELVNELILEESVNLVEFSEEADGTPLNLSNFALICNIVNDRESNSIANVEVNQTIYYNMLTVNKQGTNTTADNWVSSCTFAGGLLISGYGMGSFSGISSSTKCAAADISDVPITYVKAHPNTAGHIFAAGSRFKLYGIKIKEG